MNIHEQDRELTAAQLAAMIDHTLLKPEATKQEIIELCKDARQYQFATVCVNPSWVSLAAKELSGTSTGVTTVVGFPLGATSSAAKAFEAKQAIMDGANEIDMVLNIGLLRSGELAAVEQDIAAVAQACGDQAVLKVILESGMLSDEEIVTACELSVRAGANFVKTSTGFGKGGATEQAIALMRQTVGPNIGVKASGGVRDYDTTCRMIKAGASRIGASASVAIVQGQSGEGY
ncbi:deoxyribose-phosphate aldolase [Paenibacillus sp. GXUN7292]|uniref:deoxyribose-phosphate aldolase n=1 Tax=Paenibacillus sp. GXUN7292 TaxID=3422499 RepID=UPI003D7C90BD